MERLSHYNSNSGISEIGIRTTRNDIVRKFIIFGIIVRKEWTDGSSFFPELLDLFFYRRVKVELGT